MSSNSPGPSGASNTSSSEFNALPRGLLGRKGVPIARGARLPSIRSPRDLTLGGTPKRTFTPNLNVKRDKNKDLNDTTDSSPAKNDGQDKKRRGQGAERGRGGRGRGRGRGELIQLQGSVFGEGPAAGMIKKAAFGREERESSNHIPIPKLNKQGISRTKEEKLQDEEKLQELLRDDFIDDLDTNNVKMQPVQLPLLTSEIKAELDDKMSVKKEQLLKEEKVKIKKEPEAMEIDGEDEKKFKTKPEIPKMSQERVDPTAGELFSNSNLPETGTLLLFQFPDSLPGIAASSDDGKPDPRKKASTSAAPTQPTADDGDHSAGRVLADFPEGYIGKLQVLKSGKTRLMLGSVAFTVESGTPLGFLQDLVSVKAKEESTSEMIVLGHVKHKLVCLPDMDILLAAKETT